MSVLKPLSDTSATAQKWMQAHMSSVMTGVSLVSLTVFYRTISDVFNQRVYPLVQSLQTRAKQMIQNLVASDLQDQIKSLQADKTRLQNQLSDRAQARIVAKMTGGASSTEANGSMPNGIVTRRLLPQI